MRSTVITVLYIKEKQGDTKSFMGFSRNEKVGEKWSIQKKNLWVELKKSLFFSSRQHHKFKDKVFTTVSFGISESKTNCLVDKGFLPWVEPTFCFDYSV